MIFLYQSHSFPGSSRSFSLALKKGFSRIGVPCRIANLRWSSRKMKSSLTFPWEEVEVLEFRNSLEERQEILSQSFVNYCVDYTDGESNSAVEDLYSQVSQTGFRVNYEKLFSTELETSFHVARRHLNRCQRNPLAEACFPFLDHVYSDKWNRVNEYASWMYPLDTEEVVFPKDSSLSDTVGIFTRLFFRESPLSEVIRMDNPLCLINTDCSSTNWGLWLQKKYSKCSWLGYFPESERGIRHSFCRYSLHSHFGASVVESWHHGTIPIILDPSPIKILLPDNSSIELKPGDHYIDWDGYRQGYPCETVIENGKSLAPLFDCSLSAKTHLDILEKATGMRKRPFNRFKRLESHE